MVDKRPKNPGILSKRQAEVLAHLASGETHESIAQKLFITVATVRTHLQEAKRKLAALSSTNAAVIASEMGILPEVNPSKEVLRAQELAEMSEKKPVELFLEDVNAIAPWNNLTQKELEIFAVYGCSASGRCPSNAEIADICNISETSMKQYARRIKRGLGIGPKDRRAREIVILLSRTYNSLFELHTQLQ